MENEQKTPVEQTEKASGEAVNGKQDHVAYSSYMKALHEKKLAQEKLSDYEARLQELEEQKLSAEGKKDELIDTYKSQLDDYKNKLQATHRDFAWRTLQKEFDKEASRQNCINSQKLLKLIDKDDLATIEIGEDFSVNTESLVSIIEKSKKENPFLFDPNNVKAAAIGTPQIKPKENKDNDIKKLSMKELEERYRSTY